MVDGPRDVTLVLAPLLVAVALAAGAAAHEQPVQDLRITAHDEGPGGPFWFTTNVTGDERNPPIPLERGALVQVEFVVEGTQDHDLRLDEPVDFATERRYSPGEATSLDPVTFNVTVPWETPDWVEYWDAVYRDEGMWGNASLSGGNAAPSLQVDSPASGAEVEGLVEVDGQALDGDEDDLTVEVRLPPDDEWQPVSPADDWAVTWNTTQVEDGTRTIEVRAEDPHGAVVLAERSVEVVNDRNEPPSLTLEDPAPGAEVNGTVIVAGTAGDPDGDLEVVEVKVPPGDTWQTADGLASWSLTWNASAAPTGNHTIEARAVDAHGAASTVDRTVTVVEEPENRAPSVTLDRPADGATLEGTVRVAGNATDADGDDLSLSVRLPAGDGWQRIPGPAASGAWGLQWNTSHLEAGSHEVRVRADDGNATAVDAVTVEVQPGNRAPTVAFVTPDEGAEVGDPQRVVVEAADVDEGDAVESVRVRFADQDTFQQAERQDGTDRWAADLPTGNLPPGPTRITAIASDGEEAARAVLDVTVPDGAAPGEAPVVDVTDPPPDRAQGLVVVQGVVEHDAVRSPPVVVELRVGGRIEDAEEQGQPGSFSLSWQTRRTPDGVHDASVQARDGPLVSEPVTFAVRVVNEASAESAGFAPAPGPGVVAGVLAGFGAAGWRRRA